MVRIAAADYTGPTARAWVIGATGTYEDMKLESVEVPTPGEGQLRVRVLRASTNPVDYKRCEFPSGFVAYPSSVGIDGAGIVEAIGDSVETGAKVGDRVAFFAGLSSGFGSFAEHALVDATLAVPVPEGVSLDAAAALPTVALTALIGLEKLQVEAGKTLLVTGGAGGVGQFVIQMAVSQGVTVITTCSTGNVAALKVLGAHHVIDYTTEKIAERVAEITKGAGVAYLYDCVSAATLNEAAGSVQAHGKILSIVGPVETDASYFMRGLATFHVNLLIQPPAKLRANLTEIIQLAADKKLVVPVTKTIKLEEVKAQLAEQAAGHVKGKVVVAVTEA